MKVLFFGMATVFGMSIAWADRPNRLPQAGSPVDSLTENQLENKIQESCPGLPLPSQAKTAKLGGSGHFESDRTDDSPPNHSTK